MNYIKLAICIGLIAIGFASAWTYRGAQLDKERMINKVCVEANKETLITIAELKKQAENFNKSCEARLKSKDTLIKKLKQIENMGKKDEKVPDSPDDILNALNGMWDSH